MSHNLKNLVVNLIVFYKKFDRFWAVCYTIALLPQQRQQPYQHYTPR